MLQRDLRLVEDDKEREEPLDLFAQDPVEEGLPVIGPSLCIHDQYRSKESQADIKDYRKIHFSCSLSFHQAYNVQRQGYHQQYQDDQDYDQQPASFALMPHLLLAQLDRFLYHLPRFLACQDLILAFALSC